MSTAKNGRFTAHAGSDLCDDLLESTAKRGTLGEFPRKPFPPGQF